MNQMIDSLLVLAYPVASFLVALVGAAFLIYAEGTDRKPENKRLGRLAVALLYVGLIGVVLSFAGILLGVLR